MQVFDKLFGKPSPEQSLIARVRLSSYYDSKEQSSIYKYECGTISDLGFADCGTFVIVHHAPKAEPVVSGQFYQDKFFNVRSGDERNALGRIDIKEAYVYDFYYRSDIDFTGLRLDLTLRPSAFEEYRRFIGTFPVPPLMDPTDWHGDFLISILSPKFDFPAGHGSDPPYPPPGAKVRKLRTVKSFHFDTLDIIKVRPTYETVGTGAAASPTPENMLSLR